MLRLERSTIEVQVRAGSGLRITGTTSTLAQAIGPRDGTIAGLAGGRRAARFRAFSGAP